MKFSSFYFSLLNYCELSSVMVGLVLQLDHFEMIVSVALGSSYVLYFKSDVFESVMV